MSVDKDSLDKHEEEVQRLAALIMQKQLANPFGFSTLDIVRIVLDNYRPIIEWEDFEQNDNSLEILLPFYFQPRRVIRCRSRIGKKIFGFQKMLHINTDNETVENSVKPYMVGKLGREIAEWMNGAENER
jgi:hypothetical protein